MARTAYKFSPEQSKVAAEKLLSGGREAMDAYLSSCQRLAGIEDYLNSIESDGLETMLTGYITKRWHSEPGKQPGR